jgi:hypothetical protein
MAHHLPPGGADQAGPRRGARQRAREWLEFAAFSVADRGYVLETGRIVREGRVEDLKADGEVRKAYLGLR